MRGLGLRLLQLVPIVLIVSIATFLLMELLPGNPAIAILGETATPEQIEIVEEQLGLDDPLAVRYLDWMGNALTGDLGTSPVNNTKVIDDIVERLPVTLQLAIMAQFMALLIAVPVAIWAAYRAGRPFDRAVSTTSFALVSIPPFLAGIILVFLFSVRWQWFPVSGWERWSDGIWTNMEHAFLPALSLALAEMAVFSQLLKADMQATLEEDYVLAARAKGMPTRTILLRHALRPSSFSLITLAGVNFGRLLGGTVVIESFFSLSGLGTYITQAIPRSDLPSIQGTVLFLCVAYLLINMLVDLSYSYLDPRVRRATA